MLSILKTIEWDILFSIDKEQNFKQFNLKDILDQQKTTQVKLKMSRNLTTSNKIISE